MFVDLINLCLPLGRTCLYASKHIMGLHKGKPPPPSHSGASYRNTSFCAMGLYIGIPPVQQGSIQGIHTINLLHTVGLCKGPIHEFHTGSSKKGPLHTVKLHTGPSLHLGSMLGLHTGTPATVDRLTDKVKALPSASF